MGLGQFIKYFGLRSFEVLVIAVLLTFLPNLPPNAEYKQSYSVPAPKLVGKLEPNNKLDDVEIWHKGDFLGPEAFVDYKGELYTSIHGGDIVKLIGNHVTPVVKFGKPCTGIHQEAKCGRPLGMAFDTKGFLYACDAYYGVFKVNTRTGDYEQLVSMDKEIDGEKPKLPNSVAVASTGDVFWTDSSAKFPLYDGVYDILADGSGRLIHYNPRTETNSVLIKGLSFANGVALSAGEDFIIVAETGRARLLRYHLKGPKKGTWDIFVDGLPGSPDNLTPDGQGGFLVPLVIPMDVDNPSAALVLKPFPLIRKFASRALALVELVFRGVNAVYHNDFCDRAQHFVGHFSSIVPLVSSKRVTILHVSGNGQILDALHTTSGKISGISEAHVFKDHLYLGSPFNDYIARIPLSKIGWTHLKITPKTTQKPQTTTTPKPTTTTPKPVTTQKPTTTPRPTTTARTATTPKPTTTTTPKPTTTTPKPTTTTTPKPTTQKPALKKQPPQPQASTPPPPPPPQPKTTEKPAAAKQSDQKQGKPSTKEQPKTNESQKPGKASKK